MIPCKDCPSRTPFRCIPEVIQAGQRLEFNPSLDEGIRDIVITLCSAGIETYESCEGGPGHSYLEPTVAFEGAESEGLRAVSVALENKLPVKELRRVWDVHNGLLHGPWWVMTFRTKKSD
jgi:hypothetical protein